MTITIRIPMVIDGVEDCAELDFCTVTGKFTEIIVHGVDYAYTEHRYVMLKLLGGEQNILFKHEQNAIEEKLQERAERQGA